MTDRRLCTGRGSDPWPKGVHLNTSEFNRRRQSIPWVVLVLLIFESTATSALAIDISEKRWGFNGKVALNRFNILSVLVQNSTPQPFEGNLVLRKTLGGAGYVDAAIVESVALAPFSSKWVQFYPYINSGWGNNLANETWELSWGRGQREELPAPRVAKYQRVILDDPGSGGSRVIAFRHMPENLFPAFVSATDALQIVAMDREPRTWIPAQKEAFLDWLHLGGTLLLMAGPTGKIPEFTGTLAVLNSPLDEQRYGSGRILKTTRQRGQFDDQAARQMFADVPKNFIPRHPGATTVQDPQDPQDPIDEVDPATLSQANAMNMNAEGADPFVSSSFLTQLKDMTKPDHNWVLLHLMFWVYIGMVFPGCYLLGKRWSDFRVVYGTLLATVALFSFLFSVVGQRGYGEATAVHSVAIARSLPGGALDVTSWSNVFVTNGAIYSIKHNGRGALYSTCSESESVNGKINNGLDAEFSVDIPPFSNREFALRMRMAAGSPTVKVNSFNSAGGRLEDLSLTIEGINSLEIQAHVLAGERFYNLSRQGDVWKQAGDAGDVSAMLRLQNMQHWSNSATYGFDPNRTPQTPKERYNMMATPLMARSLNVSREADIQTVRTAPESVRVFLYTKLPAEFGVQNSGLGAQEGYVLYCLDVPLREQ